MINFNITFFSFKIAYIQVCNMFSDWFRMDMNMDLTCFYIHLFDDNMHNINLMVELINVVKPTLNIIWVRVLSSAGV